MKYHSFLLLVFCVVTVSAVAAAGFVSSGPGYHIAKKTVLGGEGGWDYLYCDSAARRIYLSRSTHVMVVDADSYAIVGDIPNTPGVHGIAIVSDLNKGFISNGRDNSVTIFDLKTLKETGRVAVGKNPDAIMYDPASKRIFTFNGGSQDTTAIDASMGKVVGTVALGGKPEFAVSDEKGHVYVNIEDKDEVAVVDTHAMKVIAHWPLGAGKHPTGMSMDPESRRLFIGCRNGKLIIMNADDGKIVTDFPIGAYVDATVFEKGLVLASCGDGTLTIVREVSPDKFELAQTVKTEIGARTMAVDHSNGTIYLPTSDLILPGAPTAENPRPRPQPVPGTFRILVVTRGGAS